jgi:CheY-like chemotaxis protein
MSNAVPPPLRILVVDDCPDTTASMGLLLRCWGHEARLARTGAEALRAAGEFQPDVVLIDIGLPGMNGLELARRLRATGLRRAFLASVTGYAGPEDRRRSLEAGCDQHWAKPIDPEALEEVLAGLQRGRLAGTSLVPACPP